MGGARCHSLVSPGGQSGRHSQARPRLAWPGLACPPQSTDGGSVARWRTVVREAVAARDCRIRGRINGPAQAEGGLLANAGSERFRNSLSLSPISRVPSFPSSLVPSLRRSLRVSSLSSLRPFCLRLSLVSRFPIAVPHSSQTGPGLAPRPRAGERAAWRRDPCVSFFCQLCFFCGCLSELASSSQVCNNTPVLLLAFPLICSLSFFIGFALAISFSG